MVERIAVVGAGAVGGYVGACLADSGQDVTLIDYWPENVEAIRRHGVQVSAANDAEPRLIKVPAVHVTEVQHFYGNPFDVAFIATKSYDTKWATMLISDYVAPGGVYVSLQNCINEDQIAGIVGWERTMGCVVSHGIGGELYEPGRIRMGYHLTNRDLTSFYVGEAHGRITARARRLAEMLDVIGPAVATPDLWGERWSKLCVNSMRNGVSAATGMYGNERDADQDVRRFCIRLGGEAVRVAQALGHEIDKVGNVDAEALASAAGGDAAAVAHVEESMLAKTSSKRSDTQRPSMAQDVAKGRRTEIDYMNGYIAAEGRRLGVSVAANERLTGLVRRVEVGLLSPGRSILFDAEADADAPAGVAGKE